MFLGLLPWMLLLRPWAVMKSDTAGESDMAAVPSEAIRLGAGVQGFHRYACRMDQRDGQRKKRSYAAGSSRLI